MGRLVQAAAAVDRAAAHVWPTMFGYQFLYVLRPKGRPQAVPATVVIT